MSKGACLLCFCVNTKVFNIKNTDLLNVFDVLSDFRTPTESFAVCYICCKRLQQCEQLVKQIQRKSNNQAETPLVDLAVASENLSTPPRAILQQQEIKIEYIEDDQETIKPKDQTKPKSKPKTFKCEFCPKAFNQSSHLYRHYNTHTGLKTYACDVCNKSYNQRDTLVRHKQTHILEDTYYCDICHTPFKRKDYLQGHMAIHIGERFECKVCGRLFNLKRLLKIHSRIHSGDKPYCCAQCGKRFNESGHLKKHMLTHDDRQFKCDICQKTYKRLIGLKTHRRSHDRVKSQKNVKIM